MTVLLKKTQPSCHLYKKTNLQKKKNSKNKIQNFIFDSLPVQLKEFYLNKPDFLKLMNEFDIANFSGRK